MVEATAVQDIGRISPQDSGLWKDSQIEPLKRIVEFAHSQGQNIGIQLGHAGRKASTVAPWLSLGATASEAVGGWPDKVVAPSAISYDAGVYPSPKAITLEEIEQFKKDFVAAVKRALTAGFDVIEIHNAHGYLLQSFLSPASNKRTDQYGGSFENRVRLTLEVVELARKTMPDTMPLFLRISATDWLNYDGYDGPSWTSDDTVRLAPLLAERGVDVLDVSTGGNHPLQKIKAQPAYQSPFAIAVKKDLLEKGLDMKVATVGAITSANLAEELLQGKDGKPGLDFAIVGRGFQKNPGLVWAWAEELGIEIRLANQIRWAVKGRHARPSIMNN
jgi:2,4-dienoyl-CoA reductase-like NADH-dependent reductase (Old Yellow Enzyme family)